MKTNEFKVGDIVNCYNDGETWKKIKIYKVHGDFVYFSDNELHLPGYKDNPYHFKQCRKQKGRRRIWVNENNLLHGTNFPISISPQELYIEFVEVRKR